MVTRHVLFWFVLMLIAVGNGTLRERTYGRSMPELRGHQISTLSAIAFTSIAVWILNRFWPLETADQAWAIGGMWLVMTVAFEFVFGHFGAGHSWRRLFADYNIFKGRVWLLFLAWLTVLPYLCLRYAQPAP